MNNIVSLGTVEASIPTLGQFFTQTQFPKPGSPEELSAAGSAVREAPKPSPTDQVEVSKAAEARLLRSQGVSLGEIEATLGVGEATVTSYLGITNGTQTLQAVAAAVVESGAASLG